MWECIWGQAIKDLITINAHSGALGRTRPPEKWREAEAATGVARGRSSHRGGMLVDGCHRAHPNDMQPSAVGVELAGIRTPFIPSALQVLYQAMSQSEAHMAG
jgi:hypothetical protein